MFVLSQCDFCSPAWLFCTTWMASCKGSILSFLFDAQTRKALDNIDLNQMSHRYVSGVSQNDWCPRLPLPWLIADSSSHWQFFYYSRAMRHSRRQQNQSAGEGLACTQMFFYFSFRSFHKHQRGRRSRKKTIFFFLHPYPLVLAVNNSPAVFVFYHAGSTDFEEKIEGLWTG